jgi:heme-degrading monooxygenase HmoA
MYFSLSKLDVQDYDKWQADWDASRDMRKLGGQKSFQIYKNADKGNEVLLIIEWESRQKAEFFLNSDMLKEALKRSGVEHLSSEYLELINKDVT